MPRRCLFISSTNLEPPPCLNPTPLALQDVSAIPVNASTINATRDVITGAASSAAGAITTASGLLSNATSALTATTNTTALNATNATVTAGGSESDSLLGSDVLNATIADGVLHSSVDKVTGVLGGVKSWLNSSRGGDGKQGKLCRNILLVSIALLAS